MNTYIVITSIFGPTKAVQEFSKRKDYITIVVGDKKTPKDWVCDNVSFISVDQQIQSSFKLAKHLPFNHYCRKMLGYLTAINSGAAYIIDTDDDNIPKTNWAFPEFEANYDSIVENLGFINIYQLFTKQKIWPRGLPLRFINSQFNLEKQIINKECNVGIWQGLADEDPDVDAIYRLTIDAPCYFQDRQPIVLEKGTVSPFNTQNTLIRKELFPLLYLPTYVSFRFTDILRGLVAQPIMWLYDYQLGFCNATVLQKRNPHDYFKDFISEIPMYKHSEKIIELVEKVISKNDSIGSNLFNAYHSLLSAKIIRKQELNTLEYWLSDLQLIHD